MFRLNRKKRIIVFLSLFSIIAGFTGCRPAQSDSNTTDSSATGERTINTSISEESNSPSEGVTEVDTTNNLTNSSLNSRTATGNNNSSTTTPSGNNTATGRATTNTAPTTQPTQTFNESVRRITGSFIQAWYVAGWSQQRWEQEIKLMSEAGMKYIILQSIADLTYNTDANLGQDPDRYTLSRTLCLYPSSLPEFRSGNKGIDSLKNCLEACKKYGLQAIIGPLSDNRWWKYGWGMPQMPSGKSDYVKDSYFAKWVKQNGELSNRIADEVMARYGEKYSAQIFGWYYNNEIWNIDVACKRTDNQVYAKILGESLNIVIRHYSRITPGKPVMLSPFINPTLSTPQQCGKMWEDIFKYTEFRKGDIFSPQDSFGGNPTLDLDAWTKAYADAAKTKSGLVFWSNNENFRENGTVATLDSFIYQINTTAKYASANICFSWNHYFSPLLQNSGYNRAYLKYITTGQIDKQAPTTPVVRVNGRQIYVECEDNDGIAGFRIFKNNNLVKTVHCRQDDNEELFRKINIDSTGTYTIEAYDFFGNKSARTSFTIK